MFVAEPAFLLYDEVREPQAYQAVLKAIGVGSHSLDEISNATLIGKAHLSAYLARLQELRLVERRLPATVNPAARHKSRLGRYHLNDAYFRFYFRFLAPYHDSLAFEPDWVMRQVQQGLRAFVGQTAFEDLARQWIVQQGRAGSASAPRSLAATGAGLLKSMSWQSTGRRKPYCWANASGVKILWDVTCCESWSRSRHRKF